MDKLNKLVIERTIFTIIIFILFSFIILNEKKEYIFYPKIKEKINIYLKENYNENFNIENIEYKNYKFITKVTNKENKHHYFYVTYSKRKIKDTYNKDFLKGKNLLNHIEKNLEKEIKKSTNISCKIKINTSLNNFTSSVRKKIIKEDNLINLKIYSIEKELMIKNWNTKEITNSINCFIKTIFEQDINPKNFNIIITNKNDITKSIKITNLTESFYNNPYQEQIINDIIYDKNSSILKENNITYKFLN